MTPVLYVVLGFAAIFLGSSLGSASVLLFKKPVPEKWNTLFLGFAGGVMVAASVFSLLLPALEASAGLGGFSFLPALVGFLFGGILLFAVDKLVPHIHSGTGEEEGPKARGLSKPAKLFLAVTIHNIPEGLAVGVSFGLAFSGTSPQAAALLSALGLAIGVAVQNFPEGAAVSLPLREATGSRPKAFLLGVASGAVEPLAAIVAFFLSSAVTALQPYLLSFAAGAMVYVVAEDLIPDSHMEEHPHLGTWGVMIGFAVMMVLDVSLG